MNRLTWLARASGAAALSMVGVALLPLASTPTIVSSSANVDLRATPALLTSNPVRFDLGEVFVGAHTDLVATITNRGDRTATLVGSPRICQNGGCVTAVDPPAAILPGTSRQFKFRFDPKQALAVDFKLRLFFDVGDRDGIVVPLALTATIIAP